MPSPIAFLNGEFISAGHLSVPVYDAGFVQGVTVSEQLRTFDGQLFRLRHHLDRLARSLQIIGMDQQVAVPDLAAVAQELVDRNHRLLADGDDLGLSLFITPGPYPTFAPADETGPTICMHTYPLPFHLWLEKYESGQPLVITDIQQVPTPCWPAELKCRSRMHYYLADLSARQRDPAARAVLLDQEGSVVEASTANLVIYNRDTGFISPPREKILPGVSMRVLEELAETLSIPFSFRDLTVPDLRSADEAILSSTSPCLLPAVSLDGEPIGNGKPGEQFRRTLAAWSDLVGIDICAQAARFARR